MDQQQGETPTVRPVYLIALAVIALAVIGFCGDEESGYLEPYDVGYLSQDRQAVIAGNSVNAVSDNFLASPDSVGSASLESSSALQPRNVESEPLPLEQTNPEGYGLGAPVDPAEDPLSTFALDVDTGSYVNARNHLRSWGRPPADTVRVEEFVNYMPGGYPLVDNQFSISMDAAPSLYDNGKVMMRVGVRAPVESAENVAAESIILVVDTSGSMGDYSAGYESLERYRLVREAISLLLGQLNGQRVGMVVYDDYAEAVLEPRQVTANNVGDVLAVVHDVVTPGGSTNAEAGLVYGFNMAAGEVNTGRNTLVLLFSDGVANVGASNTDSILETIGDRSDISLSTVGVGLGQYNDELMEQLANRADGTYHYIDTVAEAARLFEDSAYRSVAARDAKIQVAFDPAVVMSYRLLGYENRALEDDDFTDDTRDAGEVAAGQSATALYELELHADAPADAVAATVSLRYKQPRSGDTAATEASFRVSEIVEFADSSPNYQIVTVAGVFAEMLRDSPYSTGISYQQLADVLAALEGRFEPETAEHAAADELAELIDWAHRWLLRNT